MPKFRKKPVVIEASQWFENGDHPEDYQEDIGCALSDKVVSTERQRQLGFEGQVVRYYRHPHVPGERSCEHCGIAMAKHGWIDTLEGGHTACPGDWIITGVQGERYPCKSDIFQQTYEPVEGDQCQK
ncbi:PGDYG domain-containing protein [Microbulbifer sp. OS29]|uniref:PGDYG domain-containing protein n=1 Tax=Microbulbifer okhotskensis TaxID=2926617 RepID=A0A9X2ERI9_9GAMM|nr:PGDYG domain-containing protein [Microbulbifer okhotskensis]MCO1336080.1 PGDYG domain-containing protein [Microbulbifer okhotskensis]